jgi:hypothetical protein
VTRSLRSHGPIGRRVGLLAAAIATLWAVGAHGAVGRRPAPDAAPPMCPPSCNPPPHYPPCWPNCYAKDEIALVGVLGGAPPDAPDVLDGDVIPIAASNGSVVDAWVGDFTGWSRASGVIALEGDFDHDGHADIALTGGPGWNTLPVAFSSGNGVFHVTNDFVGDFALWATSSGVSALAGDFNNDGRTDVALTGHSGWGSVPVAFSNGDGSFDVTNAAIADFAGWAAAPGVARLAGDFNGDGRTDIALTGVAGWGSVPVAFSNGDGSFHVTNASITSFAGWAGAPGTVKLVGDLNGDGRADIALSGGAGWQTIPVAFSNGDGSFTVTNLQPPCSGVVGAPHPIAIGDFDSDGRTDLFLLVDSNSYLHPASCVLISNGDGSFRDPYAAGPTQDFEIFTWWATHGGPNARMVTGDFNADGRKDIAVVGCSHWEDGVLISETNLLFAYFNADGTLTEMGMPLSPPDFGTWSNGPLVVPLVGDFE